MPRISRFKRYNSDRSGFKYFEIELVKDGPWKVAGEEFDTPPPSKVPLGGEGDVAPGEQRSNSSFGGAIGTVLATPSGLSNPTQYLTAAGGITPSFTHPWLYVSGSNSAITISTNPQIAQGQQGQVLTLYCVDSAITLSHGTGLNLMGSMGSITLRSGGIITFVYTTGGSVWNEASRGYL